MDLLIMDAMATRVLQGDAGPSCILGCYPHMKSSVLFKHVWMICTASSPQMYRNRSCMCSPRAWVF
jgi:hypothetical protein